MNKCIILDVYFVRSTRPRLDISEDIYIFSASPIKSRRHDIEEVEVLVSRHDSDGESMGRHDTQYGDRTTPTRGALAICNEYEDDHTVLQGMKQELEQHLHTKLSGPAETEQRLLAWTKWAS